MITTPTPTEWLGLLLRSESDQPHEWPYLAWAVRNRVEDRRYPDTYAEVILQPRQFSYFNTWTGDGLASSEVYRRARAGYAGEESGWGANNLSEAELCAASILSLPRWRGPFSPKVLWFWAPGAMKPRGSDPPWAKAYRVFELPNVPRWRFAEG